MDLFPERLRMIFMKNAQIMKWKVQNLEIDQRKSVERLWKKTIADRGRSGTVVGGPPDDSFGFHLREAFQSQTNTQTILYNESH